VVVPVHDGEAFVADAIESVLAQREVELELVVVDDGSVDSTPGILAGYGDAITVLRQENRGHAAAKNLALPRLRGELALFLDADDVLPPGYLERLATAARARSDVDVFHGGWRGVAFDGTPLYLQESPLPIDDDPFHELAVHGSPHVDALLVRRSALERIGGFDERLRLQVDWDLCLRLAASGARFLGVPGAVALVRRRPESVSARRRGELSEVGVELLERHLRGHARCPACARSDAGLLAWRRLAVRERAARIAGRLSLPPRPGRWIGTLLAVAARPRFARAGLVELAAPWRRGGAAP
jgi:hypothetical protein